MSIELILAKGKQDRYGQNLHFVINCITGLCEHRMLAIQLDEAPENVFGLLAKINGSNRSAVIGEKIFLEMQSFNFSRSADNFEYLINTYKREPTDA